MIGFLFNYVNDFVSVSEDYQNNVAGFNEYIKSYDFIKSTDKMDLLKPTIYFNQDINFVNKEIIFDQNNNYIISVKNITCNIPLKACGK